MLKDNYPLYLAGKPQQPNTDLQVTNKYTGEVATKVAKAGPEHIEQAIAAAADAAEPMRRMHAYQRQQVLQHCVDRLKERKDDLAHALCIEAGKPIGDAKGETTRLIDTFRIAAEESVRIMGEVMPLDISERAAGYHGMWKRVPIGPCSFITPWNFPLNLVAHKVAPAIAVGCPFVLKPASQTPIGALIIGEVLAETDLPDGAFSILPCDVKDAEPFTTDERLKLLSFTGSAEVGWKLKSQAGKKHVLLELGGNAACIVDQNADVGNTVQRMVHGAFYQSGQSCISVQRIIVHEDIYEEFTTAMVAATEDLIVGDPLDEETFIGPIISEDDAKRIEQWINDAADAGATVLCGGKRDGVMVQPTLLENVPRDATIDREEVFGPVANIHRFHDFNQALEQANDSRYGLQAGVFTRDIYRAKKAWETLDVGGVIINDVPSWRVDHMPYGGVKDSGLGREGIRWAIDHMTEPRLMVLREIGA